MYITRLYWVLLVGAVCTSFIVVIPYVAIFFLVATSGLGLPIVFAPTVATYLACFLPTAVAITFDRKAALLAAAPASVLLVAVVAFTPNWLARNTAAQVQAAVSAGDLKPAQATGARSIEYRRQEQFSSDLKGRAFDNSLCDRFCEALLVGNEVDWVRVVIERPEMMLPSQRKKYRQQPPALLVAGAGDTCGTNDAARRCTVFAVDHGLPADLVVSIDERHGKLDWQLERSRLLEAVGTRRVEVQQREGVGLRRVLVHTEVQFKVPSRPLVIGPDIVDWRSSGLAVMTSTERINPVDHGTLLSELGFSLAAYVSPSTVPPNTWRDQPTDQHTARVLSVLALPPDRAFTNKQDQEIDAWVTHARQYQQWTEDSIDVLRRIIRDPRVRTGFMLDQILKKNPSLLSELMGDILDAAEARGLGSERIATQAFYAMRKADPSLLQPWRDRFVDLINAGGHTRLVALPVVGRLGLDPTPFIGSLAGAPQTLDLDSMLKAACYADDRWSPQMVRVLRSFVDNLAVKPGRSAKAPEDALEALMRHGDSAYVEHLLATRGWIDAERSRRQLFGALHRAGAGVHFC